ncbi:MAG: ABC-type transporter, integral rane subunit [Actinomycetia bacterium]|nr:ABC-type transporter, integral rane subunit [Actinomycetes bacterium]
MTTTVSYVLVGIAVGSVYATAALGLVLTYKATGIFNFGHGPVAILVAYVFWQTRADWGWPLVPAAFVSIFVVGPAIGLLLERLVFRPLERNGASTATKLAATMGVFVFVLGAVIALWGGTSKPAPSLFPLTPVHVTDQLVLGLDQLAVLGVGAVLSLALLVFLRFTRHGVATRAVVDRRELAELMAIDANRVSAQSWALGTFLAGLAGVLLAPRLLLDPSTLLLVVLGSYACAVGGRLSSLPLTYATAVGLSVLDSLTTRFFPDSGFFSTARPQYFFIAFLVLAVVLLKDIDETGGGIVKRGRRAVTRPPRVLVRRGAVVGAALVVLPFLLDGRQIGYAQRAVFFSAIFLSLVVLTGFSGQLNLGVAGFAGMGAFGAARLANDLHVPELLAIPLAALLFAVPVGVLLGFFAVRRRGLVLGLVTLAAGVLLFSYAFQNLALTGGVDGSRLARPAGFGGDRAYYLFELAVLGLLLLFARNLRSGRLGRVLTAMRDSEEGASSVGLSLARYKLLIFACSAAIAGVGGGLLGAQAGTFSFANFTPFDSLLWFTVVAVAGFGYVLAGPLGGFLFALAPVFLGDLTTLLIGLGALTLGRSGDGILGLLEGRAWAAPRRAPDVGRLVRERPARPTAADLSPLARHLVAKRRAAEVGP